MKVIGIILTVIGLIMIIGGMSYGMWQIHPVFGIITGGGFLVVTGRIMIDP